MSNQSDSSRLREFASALEELEEEGWYVEDVEDAAASVGADDNDTIALLLRLLSEQHLSGSLRDRALKAAWCMAYWGKGSTRELVPILVDLLRKPDPPRFVTWVLEEIGADATQAVPALIEMLAPAPEKKTKAAEIDCLGEALDLELTDYPAESWAEYKRHRLEQELTETSVIAANVLGSIGPNAKAAIPALISALNSPYSLITAAAAKALGSIGPDAKDAIPQLIDGLRIPITEHGNHPWAAKTGLGRMGEVAVPGLIGVLNDESPLVRELAADALGSIGPSAIPAAQTLVTLRQDTNEKVRSAALRALRKIGWKFDENLSLWSQLLVNGNEPERSEAVQALRQMGSEALPALNALTVAVEDKDYCIRWRAIAALSNLGSAAIETVPVLSNALSDPSHFVRCYAAMALFRIVPAGTRVIKKQHELCGDSLSVFIEKRVSGKWVCANDKRHDRFFDETPGIAEYELRSVATEFNACWGFEALIAHSIDDDVGMKATPRGLPVDISAEVLAMAETTDGGLCHSWLTLKEMLDYSDPIESNDVDFSELIKRIESIGAPDTVRIVFWLNE